MLGVFSSEIVTPPDKLVAAGNRGPSLRTTALALLKRYINSNLSSVSVQIGDQVRLGYSRHNESLLQPRSFGVKDDIFCFFEGMLDKLGNLRQEYGLAKSADEDQSGRVPLYWGITADGFVAFSDDAEMLKGACGKSLAFFPQGCFCSTAVGELQSYENPKNMITAIPAGDEEIWGATFKVQGPLVLAATE
ncbi:hypothetical protein PTKIN_Ptkin15bG0068000 [Pterospermum kingtungense]